MYSTAYNLWTFTWFVHFELPFWLKGTEKIHTERFFKFPSNIYSILYGYNASYSMFKYFCNKFWLQISTKMNLKIRKFIFFYPLQKNILICVKKYYFTMPTPSGDKSYKVLNSPLPKISAHLLYFNYVSKWMVAT